MTKAVVEIQGLTKAYGKVLALDDVTLTIEEGVTGLLGPNGAGKSTLLLCTLGLLRDWRGVVEVLGLDARRQGIEVRRRVGYLPERDAYLPEMTGIRAVRHLGRLTGMTAAEALRRAHEVLWHVGLGEAIYRDVREYSMGMRQRFKLAQALVHDPEVLFLDEPLGGLDPGGRDELLELVRDLSLQHGKHVIWSSHILPEVQKVADQVVVLHHGRQKGHVRLESIPDAVTAYHVEIEGDAAAFAKRLDEAEIRHAGAARSGAAVLLGRHEFEVVPREGQGAASVLAAATRSGARVRRISPVSEDLEQAFYRLVAEEGDVA